jgi:hypothetical protein
MLIPIARPASPVWTRILLPPTAWYHVRLFRLLGKSQQQRLLESGSAMNRMIQQAVRCGTTCLVLHAVVVTCTATWSHALCLCSPAAWVSVSASHNA